MRADARNLLRKLSRSGFRYREFVDRFAELESWPVFEALLRDPRILPPDDASTIAQAPPGDGPCHPAARAGGGWEVVVQQPALPCVVPVSSLFGEYGAVDRAHNLRAVLQSMAAPEDEGGSTAGASETATGGEGGN